MNNLEWLRTLDADAIAELTDHRCGMCAYYVNGMCDRPGRVCKDGTKEWLRAEHEEPDSWERIEADASKSACEYFGHDGIRCVEPGADGRPCPARESSYCIEYMAKDIIRRCMELAGKEE